MSVFTTAPYSLAQDALIVVRVSATNTYGYGATSTVNSAGAVVRLAPLSMVTPSRGSGTSTSQIEVDWTALTVPTNGGSAITSYHLLWDAGTGTIDADLVGLVSSYTSTSFTVTTSVTLGGSYKFKLRARNVYGWGPYSSEFVILASDVPS